MVGDIFRLLVKLTIPNRHECKSLLELPTFTIKEFPIRHIENSLMAFSSSYINLPSVILIVLFLTGRPAVGAQADVKDGGARYAAIFSFGDSLTDTGNYLISGQEPNTIKNFPYGETFFHRPTGRYCDGRIILDFIAQNLGLPFSRPYLAGGSGKDYQQGVNFAVGGATAKDNEFFRIHGFDILWTEYSLSCQLGWFRKVLALFSSSNIAADPSEILSKSLIMLGEIGGNDYIYSLTQQKDFDEMISFVPGTIKLISSAAKELISLGARTIVVPGLTPFGCVPLLLTEYQRDGIEGYYDSETGCIKWLNEFAEYHNKKLEEEVQNLQKAHPQATIVYGDYYGTAMKIYQSPQSFGFEVSLASCCGAEGPYNINSDVNCGDGVATACSNPSEYVSWDGVHHTEAVYKIMADELFKAIPASPPELVYKSSI